MRYQNLLFFLCMGFLVCGISGCGNHLHVGNGHWVTRTRTVLPFERLSIDGHFKIDYHDHQPQSLQVSADQNLLPFVTTHVVAGELRIGLAPGVQLKPSQVIALHLSNNSLEQLSSAGSNQVTLYDMDEPWLRIHAGRGDQLILKGKVQEAIYAADGAAIIDASQLEAKDTTATLTGSSEMLTRTHDRLDVRVSGVSKVSYMGQPVVQQHVSDRGIVKHCA